MTTKKPICSLYHKILSPSVIGGLLLMACPVVAQTTPLVALSAEQIQSLRKTPARWHSLQQECDRLLLHGTEAAQISEQEALSATVFKAAQGAYTTALCYQLTGKAAYARYAQHRITTYAPTLLLPKDSLGQNASIAPVQEQSLSSMAIAAHWVQGVEGWVNPIPSLTPPQGQGTPPSARANSQR